MKKISVHQWMSLSSLFLLGPMLRLLPRAAVVQAGRAAWLCALPALPLLLVYARFLADFWQARSAGEGLGEASLSILGPKLGRGLLFFYALWLLLYGGFVLRCMADRLVVTVYPHSAPGFFTLSMGLCCLVAALGSARSLARTAKLLIPPVFGILLLLLLVSLKGLEKDNVLPVTLYDLPGLTRAAVPVLDVLGLGLFLPLFFLGFVEKPERSLLAPYSRWLLGESALLTLLVFAVAGSLGAEIVGTLSLPFFTLVRNLVFFRSLERIEALVVACWIFPDFLLASLCFFAGQYCVRLALGEKPLLDRGGRLDFGHLRWLIPFCVLAATGAGLLLAPDLQSLRRLSERIVPVLNLVVCYLSVPLLRLAQLRCGKKAAQPGETRPLTPQAGKGFLRSHRQ